MIKQALVGLCSRINYLYYKQSMINSGRIMLKLVNLVVTMFSFAEFKLS